MGLRTTDLMRRDYWFKCDVCEVEETSVVDIYPGDWRDVPFEAEHEWRKVAAVSISPRPERFKDGDAWVCSRECLDKGTQRVADWTYSPLNPMVPR